MARWANPSSPHAEGRAARATLEQARTRIATAYGWAGELLFTGGASESLAIAIERSVVSRRLISAVEHDAVLRHAEGAQTLPVSADGLLDLDALRIALDGPRAIVAMQWANSETGVRQPIAEIAALVHAAGSILLIDAAQMPARADEAVTTHADLVVVSAHKRGGPIGVGGLMVRDFRSLHPTGGQEKGYRSGTENVPGVLGFAAALAESEEDDHYAALRVRLDTRLETYGAEIVAKRAPRHPAIGSYRMPGVASTVQLIRFDMGGIAVSAGSACSSGSMRPSHVLVAMGWEEPATREVVRVSFGRDTREADVDRFAIAWGEIARDARSRAA